MHKGFTLDLPPPHPTHTMHILYITHIILNVLRYFTLPFLYMKLLVYHQEHVLLIPLNITSCHIDTAKMMLTQLPYITQLLMTVHVAEY